MTRAWAVLYRGVLAGRRLTQKGAEALAFELIKSKGWRAEDVEVVRL